MIFKGLMCGSLSLGETQANQSDGREVITLDANMSSGERGSVGVIRQLSFSKV